MIDTYTLVELSARMRAQSAAQVKYSQALRQTMAAAPWRAQSRERFCLKARADLRQVESDLAAMYAAFHSGREAGDKARPGAGGSRAPAGFWQRLLALIERLELAAHQYQLALYAQTPHPEDEGLVAAAERALERASELLACVSQADTRHDLLDLIKKIDTWTHGAGLAG